VKEQWKQIEGFPDYEISSHGKLWSNKRRRLLKESLNTAGYPQKYLWNNRKKKLFRLHQLVMKHFGPPQPSPSHEINHIDAIRNNNDIENLEWCTHSENLKHGYKLGTVKKPPSPTIKLDEVAVKEIRDLADDGVKQIEIADMYCVSRRTINNIVNRKTWS
jgi:hypothetical protein